MKTGRECNRGADTNNGANNAGGEEITDTRYTYDALGRLKTVTVRERKDVSVTESPTIYTYDKVGNLDQVELPNGAVSDYVYDNLNRLDDLIQYRNTNGVPG